ncbi:BON domain-containing protein [Pseudocnuella soli]|uniref:BON domain-containing protein n=1 Tax=Pseudocnuella soli TaxID=2502779 RepID=UPI00195D58DF|nr:BON domain-containing protein [Pseudocnuella soli]
MEHENQWRNSGYNARNQQWNSEHDDQNYGQQNDWNEDRGWGTGQQNRVAYGSGGNDYGNQYTGASNRGQQGGYGHQPDFGMYENDRGYDSRNEGTRYGNTSYGGQQYSGQNINDQYRNRDSNNAYGYGHEDNAGSRWGQRYGAASSNQQQRLYSGGYGSDYNSGRNQYHTGNREGHDRNDRSWWDRSRDEVSSWFGDDDAERRRDMDRVDRSGPHYGKGPRGYQRSQERIKEDVCHRLSDDDRLDASEVEVEVQDNEVILSGKVHSKEEKRRAEDLAERIAGVSNVTNRLRIDHSNTGTDTWSQSIGI